MIWFVFGCIFAVFSLVAFGLALYFKGRKDFNSNPKSAAKWTGLVLLALSFLLFLIGCSRIVDANTVGIPTQAGHIGAPMDSGYHFVLPWTEIHPFSTRMQETSMLAAADEGDKTKDDSIEVRGSDGYKMNVDITIRYFIEPDHASALFKLVGSESGVRDRLVRPEVRNRTRVAFANYTSEEGYTSKRDQISDDLFKDLKPRLEKYGLRIDSVAIRNVEPDPVLGKAISDRAAAREAALQAEIDQKKQVTEAETRKKVAETDAQSKLIAAQAEADANRIVAESLTDELLMLKRIEALRDANTVYVPDGTTIITGATQK